MQIDDNIVIVAFGAMASGMVWLNFRVLALQKVVGEMQAKLATLTELKKDVEACPVGGCPYRLRASEIKPGKFKPINLGPNLTP